MAKIENYKKRILVVGDIHGQIEALEKALELSKFNPSKGDSLIMLGDLIDRGYGSKETLDFVMELVNNGHALALRGNHEQLAIDAYASGDFSDWFENGGDVSHDQIQGDKKYIEFMESMPYVCILGKLIFVHAGLNPEFSIKDQNIFDLLWIREEYIEKDVFPELTIFSGHTPVQCFEETGSVPVMSNNKIFIDTGAAYGKGGKVTICDVESHDYWQADCK